MNTYYEVIAKIDGDTEVLFGSFDKKDCTYEIEAERDSWKGDGYKGIKIVAKEVTEAPSNEVYGNSFVTSNELYMQQAPSFNFELDEEALLERALESGFVTKAGDDLYLINPDY